MKKNIMFILLAISISMIAQKYVPFPTENSQWKVRYLSMWNTRPIDTTLLKYSFQGDTIINSIIYKKVCRNIGTNALPIYKGVGGLREQNKKIYYCGESYNKFQFDNNEQLFYDFTKQVGDTVWINQYKSYVILAIDSIKIGSEYRKRYKTTGGYMHNPDYIIEGIGSVLEGIFGRITEIPTCLDCFQRWEFASLSQNGECIYKNPAFVDCNSTDKWSELPYVPFPKNNASWSEIHAQQGACEPLGFCRQQYKMLGDTTINSVLYNKIYKQEDSLATNFNAVYFGAIREESKKIYFKSLNCKHEIRLYDFSKNVGDTLTNFYSEMNLCNPTLLGSGTITAIDSILIAGSFRRVFHLDVLNNGNVWIEGIGSTNGLFNSVIPAITCNCSWHLICYHQNNQVKFLNNDSMLSYVAPHITCFPSTIDGINNVVIKNSVFIIPNPVTATSTLKWSDDDTFLKLTITDLLGKVIQTVDVSGRNETCINRNDFSKGIYIGKLQSNSGSEATVKIIVQ
jgi:hypothetical protein